MSPGSIASMESGRANSVTTTVKVAKAKYEKNNPELIPRKYRTTKRSNSQMHIDHKMSNKLTLANSRISFRRTLCVMG